MAKLVWSPVTTYLDGTPILDAETVGYKVYWKTADSGYNNLDVKDAGVLEELDLAFLSIGHYLLAATAVYQGLESVRSLDCPFSNVPPASPSGLNIL